MNRSAGAPRRALRILLILLLLLLLTLSPRALAAEIGNQWPYTLIHRVTVTNDGDTPAWDIAVEVPLADEGAYLYCQNVGVEYSPYPSRIVSDDTGHRAAVYYIDWLGAGDSIVLTQRYALRAAAVNYGEDVAAAGSAYSEEELAQLSPWLEATPRIQAADPSVTAFVQEHTAAGDSLYQKARSLFSAVNLRMSYSASPVDQSAVAALARSSGSCEGYVNLYLACLRAAGVACRQVSGYLYQPAQHVGPGLTDPDSGDVRLEQLRHTWVEFYLPGAGWLPADPTFTYTFLVDGAETKFVNWSYFANVSSANRYICFRRGDTQADRIRLLSATGGQVSTDFSTQLTAGIEYTPFADISGHWAEDYIRYCVENGLFNGVSPTSFAPEYSMTRAMFVTVLGRLYEKTVGPLPEVSDPEFDDVPSGSYYEAYLGWAADTGIVSGYGNGRFGPNDPVTREQMAAIMSSFLAVADYAGLESAGVDDFYDAGDISTWAVVGVGCCLSCGLLSGYPDGCFYPAAQATRAQVAAILERLSRWMAAQG
ncbi:MAG: S-layer homology domain-containing protein [Firmicutes bacterium]|nr:S-layer homology domain-containing protein [Bacillota bacterium]